MAKKATEMVAEEIAKLLEPSPPQINVIMMNCLKALAGKIDDIEAKIEAKNR